MKNKLFMLVTILLLTACYENTNKKTHNNITPLITFFTPGEIWNDTNGNPINAHGGTVLYNEGVYYWYGCNAEGLNCYSSKDLLNWTFESIITPVSKDQELHLHASQKIESPIVVYNEQTKKFVMWMYIRTYGNIISWLAVAVGDSPTGEFHFKDSWPLVTGINKHTLFIDDNGQAYHFYSTESDRSTYVNLLTKDYLKPTRTSLCDLPYQSYKTSAVFKHANKYYMISSTHTNETIVAMADSISGRWNSIGNPCIGPDAERTFGACNSYVIPVQGKQGVFVAMFDRYEMPPENTRYVWLPVIFDDNKPTIPWYDTWDMTVFIK